MLLFGTHCQELCASAKGTSEFGGYASVREFPGDSECLLHEDSKSVGTGKTHGLCGGRALRKCSENAAVVLAAYSSTISQTWDVSTWTCIR